MDKLLHLEPGSRDTLGKEVHRTPFKASILTFFFCQLHTINVVLSEKGNIEREYASIRLPAGKSVGIFLVND